MSILNARSTVDRTLTQEILATTDGALYVESGVPKYLVTPEMGGVPTPRVLIDGVGTASLIPYYLLATVADDDVVASEQLQNGHPDAIPIRLDSTHEITSSQAITDLYLIAVGNTSAGPATAAPANYTGNVGIVANTEADAADWLAQMQHLEFAEADDVRRVTITVTPVFGTNYCAVFVQGASYAS